MPRVQLQRFVDLARPTAAADDGKGGAVLNRRRALGLGAALAVGGALAPAAMARDFSPGAAPVRYPEPDVVVLDGRFRAKLGNAPIQRLYHGTLWAEGPAWNGVGRYLVWSDIPNNEQLRWLEEDGHVGRRFRSPSRHSNGNTFDFKGRQIAFCHFPREVIRYEHDGSITVLADADEEGRGLNAPNDGMVHPDDGSIWFTDPGYGALMNYEGERVPEAADSPRSPSSRKPSTGSTRRPGRSRRSRTSPSSPTACASATTTPRSTSPTPAPRTIPRPRPRSGSTTSTATA